MTEQTKKQEQTLFDGVKALVNTLTTSYNTVKYNDKTIQDIIDLSIKYFTVSKDFDKIYMLFYDTKIGQSNFYNKFLRGFFEYAGVKIEYNIYKKKIFYYGKIKDISLTYKEYKEQVKHDKDEYEKSLTIEQRLSKRLSYFDKLDKTSLDYVVKYMRSLQQKKNIDA